MNIKSNETKCPNCGGTIELNHTNEIFVCDNCHKRYRVKNDTLKRFISLVIMIAFILFIRYVVNRIDFIEHKDLAELLIFAIFVFIFVLSGLRDFVWIKFKMFNLIEIKDDK